MQISILLAEKGMSVATIQRQATVAQAVGDLNHHGIGALVVSHDGSHIEGIVSERDIVRHLNDLGGATLNQPVESIMSPSVHTCSPDDDVESLMSVMTNRRIRHVPVVRDGTLCGIVSIGDVVKSRIGELEKHRSELLDYIGAR